MSTSKRFNINPCIKPAPKFVFYVNLWYNYYINRLCLIYRFPYFAALAVHYIKFIFGGRTYTMLIALLAMFKAWLLPILSQGAVEVFQVIFYIGISILAFNLLLISVKLSPIKFGWLKKHLSKASKTIFKYLLQSLRWIFVSISKMIPRFYKWISGKLSTTSLPRWAVKAISITATLLLLAAII